jgi:hypothetical protein
VVSGDDERERDRRDPEEPAIEVLLVIDGAVSLS